MPVSVPFMRMGTPAAAERSEPDCAHEALPFGLTGAGRALIVRRQAAMATRAEWNGHTVAESDECVIVEGNYYFPPSALRTEFFRPSSERTRCPWKGDAHYYDLVSGGTSSRSAAWFYPQPLEKFQRYAGYVAFWKDVRVLTGRESVQRLLRPGAHTPNLEQQESAYEFLRQAPKTEIHLHLEALASCESIHELMQRNGREHPEVRSLDDLYRKFQVRTLDQFIDLFINIIQPAICQAEDFRFLMRDAEAYLKRNNVRYAEIHFAPTRFLKTGIAFGDMVDVLHREAVRIFEGGGPVVKFLVDVSRSYGVENASANLELTLAHRTDSIIGIGLGGAESRGQARDFAEVFARAGEAGLRRVAHAGEDLGPDAIWDALRHLGAERIGHCTSGVQDPALIDHLRKTRVPVEACPTSNVFTGAFVTALGEHPIREFFEQGLLVTVNTDDPSIFGVELADEYMNLFNHCNFSLEDCETLVCNGIFATFLPESEKEALWQESAKKMAEIRAGS